jgi:hypothetical protein
MDFERYATIIAAVFAAWSAYESRRAASASRDTAEAQLLADFLRDYSEPNMADALRLLRAWNDTHQRAFVDAFMKGQASGDHAAVRVDAARRHVKSYFEKCAAIYDAGLMTRSVGDGWPRIRPGLQRVKRTYSSM